MGNYGRALCFGLGRDGVGGAHEADRAVSAWPLDEGRKGEGGRTTAYNGTRQNVGTENFGRGGGIFGISFGFGYLVAFGIWRIGSLSLSATPATTMPWRFSSCLRLASVAFISPVKQKREQEQELL